MFYFSLRQNVVVRDMAFPATREGPLPARLEHVASSADSAGRVSLRA